MVLSDFQMSEMKELFAMMDNFAPNTIQFAMKMVSRSRIKKEVVKCLPTANGPLVELAEVQELFDNDYLKVIPGQGGNFFRIGQCGQLLKKKLDEDANGSRGQ